MEAPANWSRTIENIRKVRQKYPAPVDTMGCAQSRIEHKDANQRFQVLVSLMLSSQTKDPITWAAVQRLRDHNLCNVKAMVKVKEKDIEDLIYPVGFYRRKSVYLKKVAQILEQEHGSDVPKSIRELCDLPGVGPKMAHLCMNEAWNVVTGIGVDVHVHRIAGRLGWVPSKGIKTPEDTRKALESWLPREYWREINLLLVGFGQTICTPTRPKCSECYNSVICPKIGVVAGVKKATKIGKRAESSVSVKVESEGYTKSLEAEKKGVKREKVEEVPATVDKEEEEVVVKKEKVEVSVKVEDNEDTKPKIRTSSRIRVSRSKH